tara:strand:+ start:1113 stop:1856 length:744 start_codon:yes stop_codon:yes gene_type:complete
MDPIGGAPIFDYEDSTCSWMTDIHPTTIIQNLNSTTSEVSSEIRRIMDIKQEFHSLLNDCFDQNLNSSEEMDTHVKLIDDSHKIIQKVMKSFQKQQQKVIELEADYKKELERTKEDIQKLDTFIHFLNQMNNKYQKEEIEGIEESLSELCKKIEEKNCCNTMKKDYQKELNILKYYFEHFIKKLNQGNIGNTCSLCLQRPVDTFINPCGHTGCKECIQKLSDSQGEYTSNCFICREKVLAFKPLYFI